MNSRRLDRAGRGLDRDIVALMLVTAMLWLAGCSAAGENADRGDSPQAADLPDLTDCPDPTGLPATGEPTLPVLTLPCLDGTGGELTLGEAPGVPTVVNLWATWCTPCRDEMPLFNELYLAPDRGQLLVVGVVTRDGPELAAEFVDDLGIEFPSGIDENGDLYIDQGLRGLPGTFFLDPDGTIVHAELAPITSYEDLVALVQQHLGLSV